MRLLIILFLTTLLSCIDKEKNDQKLVKNNTDIQTNIDCNDFILKVDIDKEDFNVVNKGDTIFIYKELYGSIESKRVSIIEKENKLSNLEVSESIENGFYQRMTDDNKSFALNIFYNTANKPKKLASNEFISSDSKSFKSVLLEQHFFDVKKESLKKQNKFYKNLLENKKDYEDCCPEYIEQAKNFLKKKDESFKNFDSLNISPFINKNIITIKYSIKKVFKRKIIVLSEEKEGKKKKKMVSPNTTGTNEINSWNFNPSKTENFKLSLYHPDGSSENQEEYFSYGFLVITGGQKTFESKKIIRIANKNSPYSGFEKIVSKNIFFTIEQHGDNSDYSTYEYITFKYENKSFYLHKYSIEYTSKNNPDENIPSKNFTKKDFGIVKFENVTEKFLEDLRSNR